MIYENILLLGYLTDEGGHATRPVIGIPFISRTLYISPEQSRDKQRIEINQRLNMTEHETVVYDLTTRAANPRYRRDFSLVVLKPGYREPVREFLKGGIVWVSTGGILEYLKAMRYPRERLYRSYIRAASHHPDIAIFQEILKNSKVGT